MPESKGRGTPKPQPAPSAPKKEVPTASPRWLVPVMLGSFILGLLWIVAYYIAPGMPVLSALDQWNMVVGFGLIMVGFGLSTKWR
jgi:Cell division protein CrgA